MRCIAFKIAKKLVLYFEKGHPPENHVFFENAKTYFLGTLHENFPKKAILMGARGFLKMQTRIFYVSWKQIFKKSYFVGGDVLENAKNRIFLAILKATFKNLLFFSKICLQNTLNTHVRIFKKIPSPKSRSFSENCILELYFVKMF